MNWHRLVNVQIIHDYFDLISLGVNLLLGIVAIASLWISRRALKKSEFDSAMTTSPSIIVRPRSIWVGTKDKKEYAGHGVVESGRFITKNSNPYDIAFCIEFECFNAGRGVAFNVSQPKMLGLPTPASRKHKIPLYLTKDDQAFEVTFVLNGTFDEIYEKADAEIPISVSLTYTNDQNNIFCRSTWQANIKPFDKDGENLKVRDTRLLQRSGKIEYSQIPYEN